MSIRRPDQKERRKEKMRKDSSKSGWRAIILIAAMAAALLLSTGTALALTKLCPVGSTADNPCEGTDSADTLFGTGANSNFGASGADFIRALAGDDEIAGSGGNDTTDGGSGNDVYLYQDFWGSDTVVDPGGIDTLDFSAATLEVGISLCPEVNDNGIAIGGGETFTGFVRFSSKLENAKGGSRPDQIVGCTGTNRLSGGGGGDTLEDFGGSVSQGVFLPESDDVYAGFGGASAGLDSVKDHGGSSDVADLRPLKSTSVRKSRIDLNADGTANSLLLQTGENRGVVIANHFGDDGNSFSGRIEKIKFKDRTISPSAASVSEAPAGQSAATREALAEAATEGPRE
jgi:RTX calcium-binding nonapeptide repeat (4 copies)